MVRKTVRLSDKLNEKIEEEAKRLGISWNLAATNLWKEALKKGSNKAKETMYEIHNKYEGKRCIKCNNIIPIAARCWWARGVGLVCENCRQESDTDSMSDKTLAKHHEKERKLKKIVSGYTKLTNELADKYEEEFLEKSSNIKSAEWVQEAKTFAAESKKRQEQWQRYHNQKYMVEGVPEKEYFREFIEHDLMLMQLYQKIIAKAEEIEKERERVLFERAKREKKKKKSEGIIV